jgi:hypothetical protein
MNGEYSYLLPSLMQLRTGGGGGEGGEIRNEAFKF